MKQTAVEWLAEKYNYVTWMSNRDEISAGMADEWRKHYLEQAKAMDKEQKLECWNVAHQAGRFEGKGIAEENWQTFEQYYNETYAK
jgi:hypothetical protein